VSLPVALVVDTGVDDALALVTAAWHPALSLVAVVATGGNAPLEQTAANTLGWTASAVGHRLRSTTPGWHRCRPPSGCSVPCPRTCCSCVWLR
jgi:hypothetical protein